MASGDTERDIAFMQLALREAEGARGRTTPNPLVGAVVVREGRVVSTGTHERPGGPHAERVALAAAGEAARGAHIYVTLEPCCHTGKTGPCTDALVAAGVSRVIAGVVDPFLAVSGQGIAQLRAAGIEVVVGVCEDDCRRLNRPFFRHVETGLPWVTAKFAMSLDGKIATEQGHSQWISGSRSRNLVHRLRDTHDAVLVGARTLQVDNPSLTTRGISGGRDAIRVVVDPHGSIASDAKVLRQTSTAPTWVLTAGEFIGVVRARLSSRDDVIGVPVDAQGRLDLSKAMAALGERGVQSCLVEGGGETIASLLGAGLVQEVIAFVAPVLIGGREAPTGVGGPGVATVLNAPRLTEVRVDRFGDDVCIRGIVGPSSSKEDGL